MNHESSKAAFILQQGLVSPKELDVALRFQRVSYGPLEMILWKLGLWDIDQLANFYQIAP